MNEELTNDIKNILVSVLDVEESKIDENTVSGDLEEWDSLKHMNLIMALEEKYEIEFTNDEIAELESFKLIMYSIDEKIS